MERIKRVIYEITNFIVTLSLIVAALLATTLLVWMIGYVVGLSVEPWLAEIIAGIVIVSAILTHQSKKSAIDYDALVTAANEFIAKVDSGQAKSVRSYAAFKSALGVKPDVG